MKISLRKAAKYRNRVAENINTLSRALADVTKSVSVFDPNIPSQLTAESGRFLGDYTRYKLLSDALLKIRVLIGNANHTSGIDELLAQKAYIEGRLSTLNTIIKMKDFRLSDAIIDARLGSFKERATNTEYSETTINFVFLNNDDAILLREEHAELKRKLDGIQDELDVLNATTSVELSAELEAVLRQENII